MEKEMRMLMYGGLTLGVLLVGIVPVGWIAVNQGADKAVISNQSLDCKLWNNCENGTSGTTSTSSMASSLTYANETGTPVLPGNDDPTVSDVVWNTSVFPPVVTIQGSELGSGGTISGGDATQGWVFNKNGSSVVPVVQSWTPNQVVFSFSSGYGEGDPTTFSDGHPYWVFRPGDQVNMTITPTGRPVMQESSTYPSSASMPDVTVQAVSALIAGQSEQVVDSVSFQGEPLAHQFVWIQPASGLSMTGSEISGTSFGGENGLTNAQGQLTFSVSGSTVGTCPLTMGADGVSHQTSITVEPAYTVQLTANADTDNNAVTLTAAVNQPIVSPYVLEIVNQTTGQVLASATSGERVSTTITALQDQTQQFIAQVVTGR
ncbi:hypothetical protein [Sulfoacidibacillus ferrooxidans]|uniref:Big-1 domain-containing protein n=1 Tax=Sulfoacidibacillus ferrooxidans TaxID=2005001 RepID=A0A9X1VCQ4_9BACL|nr:hypothetical protein [Sulfoacidibacillus ferrooxidans]MCI0184954.1 hypothetical protein [Sulfoacidibacillus ferrooxidans]